ncbi:hypothetical protein [Hansschlegelia plantiphila]|uniref:Uncharacterized protein n=1 Tax=Hansschlegelia plantiphila TaxID=374655 RepID=A0A9W6J097_9HYPH|nr:hypothetical protein [Hansschlegelia plantiphila]GLK67043.1 hypothetical protein GCM10008179_06810 [Hansschlegelia plantiphila]
MTATVRDFREIDPAKFKAAAILLMKGHGNPPRRLVRAMKHAPAKLVLAGLFDVLRLPYLDLEIDGQIIRVVEAQGTA